MNRFLYFFFSLLSCLNILAQNDITKFMGIPVDGTEKEMIKNLKAKGFKYSRVDSKPLLKGRFNGVDVDIFISTEKGKVARIIICDQVRFNEGDIKLRFNELCKQFENNENYVALDKFVIPEEEDISYEILVNSKRFEAVYYQLPEKDVFKDISSNIIDDITYNIQSKYSTPSEEMEKEIEDTYCYRIAEMIRHKVVWFMISESYDKYYITMFYDNELNRAHGEEL
ncbi:MAG: hypothetical protein K2G09_04935 [Paramuribaculum sp.]|nr:hypothetical protein [Paramuribaculum sp.]